MHELYNSTIINLSLHGKLFLVIIRTTCWLSKLRFSFACFSAREIISFSLEITVISKDPASLNSKDERLRAFWPRKDSLVYGSCIDKCYITFFFSILSTVLCQFSITMKFHACSAHALFLFSAKILTNNTEQQDTFHLSLKQAALLMKRNQKSHL